MTNGAAESEVKHLFQIPRGLGFTPSNHKLYITRLLLSSDSDFMLRIWNFDCTAVIVNWSTLLTFLQHNLAKFGVETLNLAS